LKPKSIGGTMSHVSTVKTQIRDLRILKQALSELKISFEEGKEINGRYIKDVKVDLHLSGTDVGLIKNSDGNYSFKGDFYGMGMGETRFCNRIVQKYTVLKLKDGLRNLGCNGITETSLENGEIKLSAVA